MYNIIDRYVNPAVSIYSTTHWAARIGFLTEMTVFNSAMLEISKPEGVFAYSLTFFGSANLFQKLIESLMPIAVQYDIPKHSFFTGVFIPSVVVAHKLGKMAAKRFFNTNVTGNDVLRLSAVAAVEYIALMEGVHSGIRQ